MRKTIVLTLAAAACLGLLLACPNETNEDSKYKVTFDLKLPAGILGVTNADTPAAETVKKGKNIDLPIITKSTSHNHTGWSAKPVGTVLTSPYKPTKKITLYAQWTQKNAPFTVIYNINAAGVEPVPATPTPRTNISNGGTVGTLPTVQPSTSHNFEGWWTKNGTGGDWGTEFLATTPVTISMEVFAKWVLKAPGTMTVTFRINLPGDAMTGRPAVPASIDVVPPAENVGTLPTPPTTDAYEFAKWTMNADGTGGEFNENTTVTEHTIVYAQWTLKPPQFTVGTDKQTLIVSTIGSGTAATLIPNGYRVAVGNYSQGAYFKVNLGSGKKITDFIEVRFDFEAISGDIDYKTYYLLVSDTTSISLNATPAARVSGFRWWQAAGSSAAVCTIGEVEVQGGTEYVTPTSTASEVYVCLYVHAAGTSPENRVPGPTTFSVANIEFVPIPDGHQPVESIFGVPDVGEVNKEINLATANALPSMATNKTIVWSVEASGTTGVTTINAGKFTPTAVGTITVKATITNGLTETTDYEESFDIAIRSVPTEKSIRLTNMAGAYVGTLDGDGLGFTVTGGVDYEWKAATFDLNLGSAELKDVVKVTFNYTPLAGDYNYKPIYFAATGKDGAFGGGQFTPDNGVLGTVQTEGTTINTAKPLEIVLNYTLAKAIEGSEVQVAFVVSAKETGGDPVVNTSFKINNIRFHVAE